MALKYFIRAYHFRVKYAIVQKKEVYYFQIEELMKLRTGIILTGKVKSLTLLNNKWKNYKLNNTQLLAETYLKKTVFKKLNFIREKDRAQIKPNDLGSNLRNAG